MIMAEDSSELASESVTSISLINDTLGSLVEVRNYLLTCLDSPHCLS